MEYKNGGVKNKNKLRKQVVEMNRREKEDYDALSSNIDDLNLQDVDSEILDNFDTSYEYSIHIGEDGERVKMPKVSEADK